MAVLASSADFTAGPFSEVVRDFVPAEIDRLMARASRSIESRCDRRLAPFAGLVESHQLHDVSADDQAEGVVLLEWEAALATHRAAALGSTGSSVRHVWLRQHPPAYPDMWAGAVASVALRRPMGGMATVTTGFEFEPDLGHLRFGVGTWVPRGTTVLVTYAGGYPTVPEDLAEATLFQAARLALRNLLPQARPEIDDSELRDEIDRLIAPFRRP